jgi:rubrerythrin
LLEDFDHMYRYSALMDRVMGKDSNAILQCYTDVLPGRPTAIEHRVPDDDLRNPYDRRSAAPITKLNALTIMAGENQTHDYYMTIGPMFADPVERQLYAEIASIEEQHVTQYESIIDPTEPWLEKWLMHEAAEVYNYWSCVQYEPNPRIKKIWERFLDYELGHLHFVMELCQQAGQDPARLLPAELPDPIDYRSQREFVRQTLRNEADLRAKGTQFIHKSEELPDSPSVRYREQMNRDGSPSETVSAGFLWTPGTELVRNGQAATAQARRKAS